MKKVILEEIENMKYLLGYKRGVVISEQQVGNQKFNFDANQIAQGGGINYTPTAPADMFKNAQATAAGLTTTNNQPKTPSAPASTTTSTPASTTASPTTGPDATQMECIKQYGQNPTSVGVGPLSTKVWLPNSDGSYSWFGKDYSFQMVSNKFKDESVGTWACNSGKLTITLNNKQTWADGKWSGDPFIGIDAAGSTTPESTTPATPIKIGVKYPSIEELQNTLITKFQSNLTKDGKYGPKTAASVLAALQKVPVNSTETKTNDTALADPSKAAQETAKVAQSNNDTPETNVNKPTNNVTNQSSEERDTVKMNISDIIAK
jgi:hypothetical protein